MAKAEEIIGLDCAADILDWIAEVLHVRFTEMADWREAALDFSDAEGVHSMRVAVRRLRSALRNFMPYMKEKPPAQLRTKLKKIADALGVIRDQDVAFAEIEKFQAEAEKDSIKKGIGRLIAGERRDKREAAQSNLAKIISEENFNELRERFTKAIEKLTGSKRGKRVISFNEAGHEMVAARLQKMLDLKNGLYKPCATDDLHKLRIAAKHLRDVIELYAACWGERIALFAEEIAEMQSLLGDVHDCDVWIKNLSKRLKKSEDSDSFKEDDFAAVWLLSKFTKKRTKRYRSALRLWSKWQAKDFIEKLRKTI